MDELTDEQKLEDYLHNWSCRELAQLAITLEAKNKMLIDGITKLQRITHIETQESGK